MNKNNSITTTTGTVLSNVIIGEIKCLNLFDSVDNICLRSGSPCGQN